MKHNKPETVSVFVANADTGVARLVESDVPLSRVLRLIDKLSKTTVPDNACLLAEKNNRFTADVRYAFYPEFKCKIMTMSLIAKFNCVRPACERNDESLTAIDCCSYNLANGKCQDEYIRSTVGQTLFPRLYAKVGQKTK